MGTDTDQELIQKIKDSGDERSIKELAKRHSGLYHQMIRRHFGVSSTRGKLLMRDASDDKLFFFYKTAMKYKPELGVKFSTFLGDRIRYHCLNTLNHDDNIHHLVFENDFSQSYKYNSEENDSRLSDGVEYEHFCTEGNPSENEIDIATIMEMVRELKNDQITQIFELKYFGSKEEKTLDAIGEKLGISYEWVRKLHNSTIKHIQQKLKKDVVKTAKMDNI